MTKLRYNVIANFVGQGWTALIGVIFIPLYIRLLGMEAYGLIGVYVGLQGMLFVLDMGLSAALNRQLARHAHRGDEPETIRDTVRTLELLFWPLCLAASLVLALVSPMISAHWLQPVAFSQERVTHALILMCLAIAMQWPSAFYAGGLNGLEQQVPLNIANMVFAGLRWIGVIPVLWWIAPSIEVYLYWQVAVAAFQTFAMRLWLWRALPPGARPPRFRINAMRQVRGFALGVFAIAVLSFLLVQIDRIVLSRTLPLDQFGHYVLAATVAAALSRAFNPFFTALYPRYSGLVANDPELRLKELYLDSNRYLAILVCATAAVLVVFSRDTLFLWTGDHALAATLSPVLSILAAGAAFNGLMNLPYALQLAHGWTRLALWVNGITLLVMVPLTFWLARKFGMIGPAGAWLAINAVNFLLIVPVIHRRLLPSVTVHWYLIVLPSLLASLAVALALRLLMPAPLEGLLGFATLCLIGVVVLLVSFLASGTSLWVEKRNMAGP